MNRLPLFALIASAAITLPVAAQFKKPEDAIKYRQSAMFLQGETFGRVFAMASGKVPFDAKVMNENIELVNTLNHLQFAAFLDGTDKGAKTQAKPEIWSQRDKFNAAVKRVADAYGTGFVDVRTVPVTFPDDLADPVHPAQAWSDRITALIAKSLGA